ncbi:MAG: AsnC family transcriptional regulator [Promethearchaeota archaeon]
MIENNKLDDKDEMILQLLQKDGRMSLSDIGREIGMSHVSVGKRIKKLEKEILKITPALNFKKLGYKLSIVFVEAKNDIVRETLITLYKDCPRTIFLTKTTGDYNILTIMLAENSDVQESELGQCAIRIHSGIRRSKVITGEVPIKPNFIQCTPPERNRETAPCGPNCAKCKRYQEEKCLGCPATKHYKG